MLLVSCKKCSEQFQAELGMPSIICPKCGSGELNIAMMCEEQISELHDRMKLKQIDPSRSGKDKLRMEFIQGDELRKTDGEWMDKTRRIDKDNNSYFEQVTEKRSGKITHICKEKLTDHFGHGSAKTRKVK